MKVKTWTSAYGLIKVKVQVEDHDNGFMVVGTNIPDEARKALSEYVDDVEAYGFATPTHYSECSACWLTTHPGHNWEGSTDECGRPLPRVKYN